MKVKIKGSGYVFIAVTILLGVASANTSNNLLYMIVSAMLSFMLVSGIVSILNLLGLRVYLKPPPEVFAGKMAYFDVSLRKESRIPSFLIEVSSDRGSVLFPTLSYSKGKLPFLFERRGRIRELEVRVSSDFPAGLFVRYINVKVPVDLVVFPSPKPTSLHEILKSEAKSGGDLLESKTRGFDEIRGIKGYQGEPLKLIHWKLSAKREDLVVKDTVSQETFPIVLSLEMVEGNMEERISKLSYLVIKLLREGYSVGLRIGDKEIPPASGEKQKVKLLTELALI